MLTMTPSPSPNDIVGSAAGGPNLTDWVGAAAALATVAIAVIALLYARGQVREAKAARAQTAALDVERAQPYVVMFTEPSAATPLMIDLVIRNFGQTAATDVTIELNPWPQHSPDDGQTAPGDVALPDTLPVLAPGQEWRTSWDHARARMKTALPDRHTGVVRYFGLNETPRESPIVLDWSLYESRRWVTVRSVHDAAEALRDIRGIMKKWNNSVHGGLAVYSRDGDAKDAQERERYRSWREAQADTSTPDES